jgi:4-amino-4-deoxy-L-arabinose transferase-like glycosyltransferase
MPLLLVLALAAVLRLWALGGGPDPFDVDEGYTGVDALRVLRGGWTLYFAANNGAEPLYVYLAALSTALLGPSAWALRLPAALAGVGSVLATYLLVRALFSDSPLAGLDSRVLALLVALLQALSLWHLHLSRDASRVGLLPLLATLGMWLLWEGLERGGRLRTGVLSAGAGGCFGLALYTYLPARLLPLVVAALVAHLALSRPCWLRARWGGPVLAAGVAALVAAPLAAYYATHWSAFTFRVEMVSLTNPWVNEGDPGGLLLRNLQGTAGMFAVRGDADPQYNVGEWPVFALPLAALFVLGLGVALQRWRQPACWLCLVWLAVMLLPGVLSASSPHFARQAGIIPVVYVFPALGMWVLWRWMGVHWPAVPAWAFGLAAALVVGGCGLAAVAEYFGRPIAPGPTLLERLAGLSPAGEVYVAGSEETATVGSYLAGGAAVHPLLGALLPNGSPPAPPWRQPPRFTQGFHTLLLPRNPADTLYLVEQEWWWLTAEQLLWARYDLEPQPPPAGLGRFRVLRLVERPGASPWAALPDVGWAVGARLVGYSVPAEAAPGELVGVTLRWRVVAPHDDPGQDYTFAVGLVDADEEEVAGRDWLGHPTAAWRDGDELVSWFDLCLPPKLPPGPLQATVALYSRADFAKRPVLDAAGRSLGDHVTFGELPVRGAPQEPPCGDRVHPALSP